MSCSRQSAAARRAARTFNAKAIEKAVRSKLAGWQELVTREPQGGRQFLREALAGPLRFTPEDRQYRFEGEVAIGRTLSGIVSVSTFVASPGGLVAWDHPEDAVIAAAGVEAVSDVLR